MQLIVNTLAIDIPIHISLYTGTLENLELLRSYRMD